MDRKIVFIIMGVSGSGKTTIGKKLALKMGFPFYDADDSHPVSNINKMGRGEALQDADRRPWLETLYRDIQEWKIKGGAVLACSALKESYRKILSPTGDKTIKWIYLKGDYDLILSRIKIRANHFMKTELLKSQFDMLEPPDYGMHINVQKNPYLIVNKIMNQIESNNLTADIGLIGLGVMGKSLSLNIADHEYDISVYNRSTQGEEHIVNDFMAENADYKNIQGFNNLHAFVESLKAPKIIILLVKAGHPVDQLCDQLSPLLSAGDILLDGGNSHFLDTERRAAKLNVQGIHFVGFGISGGEDGARNGPSIMPGGTNESYDAIGPILESIAAKNFLGEPCCTHIGPGGSGHFIKMVHNGIEYAEMQVLAEIYAMLSRQMTKEEITSTLEEWNNTTLKSYLLEITAKIISHKEGDQFLLDLILDKAENKGTGSWSSKSALDLGIANTMMSAAVFARYISAFKSDRILFSERIPDNTNSGALDLLAIKNAYRATRIINQHQGFELIRHASQRYNWSLNLSDIASIWTNGCIIRSTLMQESIDYFKEENQLLNISAVFKSIVDSEKDMGNVLKYGIDNRISLPCFSAAHQYWISMTTEILSANLIQAQRDYFGAHTYQRVDASEDEYFHTNWQ